jgi:hypothetical protein
MIRRLAIVLVPVLLALGAWLMLGEGDGVPVPGKSMEPPTPAAAALPALPPAPVTAEAPTTAPAEATVVRFAVTNDSDQPPLPADPKWLEVRVVDAATKQPVAGAEVRWNDGSVHPKIMALPEAERQGLYSDPERIARRFGWVTRSDASGLARITTDDNGATAHAYADGRYAYGHFGGQQTAPPDGWQLALEPDRTLRAQVLDAAGQAAVGVRVAIRMFGPDGKAPAGSWIQPTPSTAPDGIAEFRHIQTWLRWGGGKKQQFDVATWQVALDVPGHEGPAVAFDEQAPPATPIVLQMPATGRLAVRLLYEGQVLTDGVSFGVFRGDDEDHSKANSAERFVPGADGWARLPHVALGGDLTVRGSAGTADVLGTTPAPTRPGQEVQFELRCDGFYALAGRLLGPDGTLLTNARAEANIHTDVLSGGGYVRTDAQGRFVWVLTKGYKDTASMDRLALTQMVAGSPPLQVVVPPRELVRGTNNLGDLKLTAGALIVAGKFLLDPPDAKQRVQFVVETQSTRRQRSGAEVWERVENLTLSQQADGAFEVRGEVKPGRYRLTFYAQNHLPVEPLEFRVGADDLVIPIALGHGLAATCVPPANLPTHQLRGVLVPAGQVAADPKSNSAPQDRLRRMRGDRYTARSWGNSDPVDLRWMALPAGTYALEIRAVGVTAPLATIPDVVVPPPTGGDPRLVNIDLRDRIHVRKVKVVLEPKPTENWSDQSLVFVMPQADPNDWDGLPVRNDEAVLPAPAGPLDLLVVSRGFQPKRFTMTDAEATVTLEPWPSVELVFPNLPPLPEGIKLWVGVHSAARDQGQNQRQRYHTEGSSGGLEGLLQPGGSSVTVKDGRARVQVGDGSNRLSAYLMTEQDGAIRPHSLRTITSGEVLGGSPAPIEVHLSSDELKTAIEELQKAPAKK